MYRTHARMCDDARKRGAGVNENVHGRGSVGAYTVVQAERAQRKEEEKKSKRRARWVQCIARCVGEGRYAACACACSAMRANRKLPLATFHGASPLATRDRCDTPPARPPKVTPRALSASQHHMRSLPSLMSQEFRRRGSASRLGTLSACSRSPKNARSPPPRSHMLGSRSATREVRGKQQVRRDPDAVLLARLRVCAAHELLYVRAPRREDQAPTQPVRPPAVCIPAAGGGAGRQCSSVCAHGAQVAGQHPLAQRSVSSSIALSVRNCESTDHTPPPRNEHPPLNMHRRTRERRRRGRPKVQLGVRPPPSPRPRLSSVSANGYSASGSGA
ncbi:hypothetical protein DFH08DRAFT_930996 [Mycena albidolilacea]|uniref:Uncharacterized protein n=1 Tax=Mycena albidolilacea TaxID=1033008 RepID=A0AAD7AMC2_9AGAR|nr:hypothetical protein DFH08DRAFT_930996 [Mycena albidolilacea]